MRIKDLSLRKISSLLALAGLFGCSGTAPLVEETLDSETGVTVMRATPPVIFYRDSSYRAANARDFVYLGPIEVNRMGGFEYFLWLGVWSTVDDMDAAYDRDGFESVIIIADGEPMTLDASGWTLEAIGVGDPVYVAPISSAADVYYPVTIDQIRLLAGARDIEILTTSAKPRRYFPWDDGAGSRAGLRAFVERAVN